MQKHTLPVFIFPLLLTSFSGLASGFVPSTTVVVVEEETGEATLTLRNTETKPLILLSTLRDVPGDNASILQLSPPAVRVEGGKTQTVRFFLTSKAPLKKEHLRRVVFEGIPQKQTGGNKVQVGVSQNLPVIIRPAGLPRNNTPWKQLKWSVQQGRLTVTNDSPYVVRMSQTVKTLPDSRQWDMKQSFILPSQVLTLTTDSAAGHAVPTHVRLSPASTWGFSVDHWDAPISPR